MAPSVDGENTGHEDAEVVARLSSVAEETSLTSSVDDGDACCRIPGRGGVDDTLSHDADQAIGDNIEDFPDGLKKSSTIKAPQHSINYDDYGGPGGHGGDHDGDDFRDRRLAMNRVSAKLRRDRKRKHLVELEDQVQKLMDANEALMKESNELKEQITRVRYAAGANISFATGEEDHLYAAAANTSAGGALVGDDAAPPRGVPIMISPAVAPGPSVSMEMHQQLTAFPTTMMPTRRRRMTSFPITRTMLPSTQQGGGGYYPAATASTGVMLSPIQQLLHPSAGATPFLDNPVQNSTINDNSLTPSSTMSHTTIKNPGAPDGAHQPLGGGGIELRPSYLLSQQSVLPPNNFQQHAGAGGQQQHRHQYYPANLTAGLPILLRGGPAPQQELGIIDSMSNSRGRMMYQQGSNGEVVSYPLLADTQATVVPGTMMLGISGGGMVLPPAGHTFVEYPPALRADAGMVRASSAPLLASSNEGDISQRSVFIKSSYDHDTATSIDATIVKDKKGQDSPLLRKTKVGMNVGTTTVGRSSTVLVAAPPEKNKDCKFTSSSIGNC